METFAYPLVISDDAVRQSVLLVQRIFNKYGSDVIVDINGIAVAVKTDDEDDGLDANSDKAQEADAIQQTKVDHLENLDAPDKDICDGCNEQ